MEEKVYRIRPEALDTMFKKGKYNYFYEADFVDLYNSIAAKVKGDVLDVGCWTGMLADALFDSGYKGMYYGFDLSKLAIAECEKNKLFYSVARNEPINKKAFFCQASWYKGGLKFNRKFKTIYFGGVFYYIDKEKQQAFIKEYIETYDPCRIIIQDILTSYVPNPIEGFYLTERFDRVLDISTNIERKRRKVLIYDRITA